jgi:hypothetical protein
MPTLLDTLVFVEEVLYRKASLNRSRLANNIVQHSLIVRDRCMSSTAEQWETDVRLLELNPTKLVVPLDGVTNDHQGISLRYVVLFDTMLAAVVRRYLATAAAAPIAMSSSSSEALLGSINVFIAQVKYMRYVMRALITTIFREVDLSRSKLRDKPTAGHATLTTMLDASTQAAAFKPLSAISSDLKQTILTAFRVGIQSWWDEELDAARWAHALHELRVNVLETSGPSTLAAEWMLVTLKPLLARSAIAHQSPLALREYVTSAHRRLSTLSLGVANVERRNFLTNAPAETQTAVRSLITESVVMPLRSGLGPTILAAVVNGDVTLLESVSFLERLTAFMKPAHYDAAVSQLRTTRWFEEQLRAALMSSLREVVGATFGIDQGSLLHADWSHTVAEARGRKVPEIGELYVRGVSSIAEWLEQKSTVLRYVYVAESGRVSESELRRHVRATLHDAGRKLFCNAGHLLATMLHAALASKKDQELALVVVEAAFAWAADKDAFLQQMSGCLELRLLEAMPIPPDVAERERSVIAILKAQDVSSCSIQLRKLEGMLHDAEKQKEIEEAIRLQSSMDATLGGIVGSSFDVHLCILSGNMWHTIGCNPIIRTLPMDVRLAMRVVEHAHQTRWPTKKLAWAHASSRCTLVLSYTRQAKRPPVELTVSLVGASILCMFDNLRSDRIQRAELLEFVVVPSADVAAEGSLLSGTSGSSADASRLFDVALRCLVGMKVLQEETSNDAPNEAWIVVNRAYSPSARKLSAMPRSQLSALADTNAASRQGVDESLAKTRSLALKAAIVRIMKTRKECTHELLFDATVRQLDKTFLPTSQRFKHVIAELIETDYIARKEGVLGVYVYLA